MSDKKPSKIMEPGDAHIFVVSEYRRIMSELNSKLEEFDERQRVLLRGRVIQTLFQAHFKPLITIGNEQTKELVP